jgi:hypothetical protein
MAFPLQCFLVTNLSNGDSSASVARWLTFYSWTLSSTLNYCWLLVIQTRVGSHGKHVCCPATDICEQHTKHRFLYCIYNADAYKRKLSHCCLRIRCRGTVFSESLPSNGSTCHNILIYGGAFTYGSNFYKKSYTPHIRRCITEIPFAKVATSRMLMMKVNSFWHSDLCDVLFIYPYRLATPFINSYWSCLQSMSKKSHGELFTFTET